MQLFADGYFVIPDPGAVRVAGEDRRAFFQRQTTHHIDLLAPQRSLLTVLTSPAARILDVLVLLDEPDAILALALPGRGAATQKYLRSRVFFMDKVTVSDAGAQSAQIEVFGPQAAAALSRLGLDVPGEPNAVAAGADGLRLIRLDPAFGLGWRILAPAAAVPEVERSLAAAGLARLFAEEHAVARIEAGLPSAAEWNEDFTPLETGLRAAISDQKGCYTGQEIIARQLSQNKVTRSLCGLRLSSLAPASADLSAADGVPAGRLTSTAVSPRFGPIALAVVRRPHDAPGARLQVGPPAASLTAEVVPLPFA